MRIRKLSIVIPYYNRINILFNTLRSIEYYQSGRSVEVIIIDDASSKEHDISDVEFNFPSLDIKRTRLNDICQWRCPTYAYNEGFSRADGDVILINSSDCMHVGDIIGYVFENFEKNDYFAFSSYMGDEYLNDILFTVPVNEVHKHLGSFKNGWHLHSSLGNLIPYCVAINKSDLNKLRGYDERFSYGIGFDDYDFTDRVYNLKLEPKIIDSPFCVHQWHTPTKYSNTINYDLLMKLRKEEKDRIQAKKNHTYDT